MLYDKLSQVFLAYPQVVYGVCTIEYSEFSAQYRRAWVFAVPHEEILSLKAYKEETLNRYIRQARNTIYLILTQLEQVLRQADVHYFIPPVAQSSEETLLAPFSFKYAAAAAGLGWVGKNDLIITEQYGPRVRLSAVLIDAELPVSIPETRSRCPEHCASCVTACPYHALSGKRWDIHIKRAEIIDYHLCNEKRSLYLKKHGRKNECGLCMVACPYGL